MIVIGIDPGTRVTGYGIIQVTNRSYMVLDFGCIRPPLSATPEERFIIFFDALSCLIDRYAPLELAIETQFVKINVQSALKLAMIRSVIITAAAKKGVKIHEYAPSRAKSAITGNGRAKKEQVQAMVKYHLNLLKEPPEDAADALALAICHLHTLSL
ncbi:MAG: crossover junction endodeoxyribonuclease RuvC [Chlamydiales bacterium]|nr:crossover junction endodeoxyribonuclease RuvC [Chlamydiales bacterium]